MGLTQEEWRNADLYSGYDEPRYACDEWCDECKDFISTNDAVFYVKIGKKHKTLCQKHYKEYLIEEEKREQKFRRKQFATEAKRYGLK